MTITVSRTFAAAVPAMFAEFTDERFLRDWFCNRASLQVNVGGSYFIGWNDGNFAAGKYSVVEPNQALTFTWHYNGGAPQQVAITFAAEGAGTRVTIAHEGANEQTRTDWEHALDTLAALLDTGIDQRIARRPMLGIAPIELDAEAAARLGVPVTQGTLLTGVVEGMGAAAAGLQKDDVIVSLDGKPVVNFPTMAAALGDHVGGDIVPVEFYRGAQKHQVMMPLSKRPMPEYPAALPEVLALLREAYRALDAEQRSIFAGVGEEQARRRPAPGEWSAAETLGHLILTQQGIHFWLASLLVPRESNTESNVTTQVQAYTASFASVGALLDEMERSERETLLLLAALPPAVTARRATLRALCANLLELPDHNREHFAQMRAALGG